jgi:hypothetical protein
VGWYSWWVFATPAAQPPLTDLSSDAKKHPRITLSGNRQPNKKEVQSEDRLMNLRHDRTQA